MALRTNTYTAPLSGALLSVWSPLMPVAALSSEGAATARVSPSSATLIPNRSPASVFDALTSHLDEISQLPPDSLVLASSPFTRVQAVAVKSGRSTFWGVQYHPEFDLHEMARIIHCRTDLLIEAGLFADREAASDYIDKLEALHQDPTRKDIAWLIGIDADIMDEAIRLAEVRNWINRLVLPNKQGK